MFTSIVQHPRATRTCSSCAITFRPGIPGTGAARNARHHEHAGKKAPTENRARWRACPEVKCRRCKTPLYEGEKGLCADCLAWQRKLKNIGTGA